MRPCWTAELAGSVVSTFARKSSERRPAGPVQSVRPVLARLPARQAFQHVGLSARSSRNRPPTKFHNLPE
eukprot:6170699-Pleurochrysis_carterae.AAC.6